MNLNALLAAIIVVSLLVIFALWAILTSLVFATEGVFSLAAWGTALPGALFFGFWGLVAYRLWNCGE